MLTGSAKTKTGERLTLEIGKHDEKMMGRIIMTPR
jgi:hypothetical protein